MNGPDQVPDNSEGGSFDNWMDHSLPEKTSSFKYIDSTQENIGEGESQKFKYGQDPLPEKM